MYLPNHFEEPRVERLHGLVRGYPLGTLVTRTGNGLEANHLPFEIDPSPLPFGTLRGHVARANPVWQAADPTGDSLVVFHGPGAYVSPSWYPSKVASGKVVPTWNYAVVHAYGVLRAIDDASWLRGLVERLTDRHEAGRAARWRVADAPPDYIDAMLAAIVGIEITVTRLSGKWKASQNRPAGDRAGVVAGLLDEPLESAHRMAGLVNRE